MAWLAVAVESLIPALCFSVYYVFETLSVADETVLLGVGPFSYGVRYGVVNCSCDGLVVRIRRPSGLVFSADLFTLLSVSSSAVRFGKNTPRELLKPFGG